MTYNVCFSAISMPDAVVVPSPQRWCDWHHRWCPGDRAPGEFRGSVCTARIPEGRVHVPFTLPAPQPLARLLTSCPSISLSIRRRPEDWYWTSHAAAAEHYRSWFDISQELRQQDRVCSLWGHQVRTECFRMCLCISKGQIVNGTTVTVPDMMAGWQMELLDLVSAKSPDLIVFDLAQMWLEKNTVWRTWCQSTCWECWWPCTEGS